MPKRIAAAMSMIAFSVCLLIGGIQADNTFLTSVQRALVAMMVTLIVGFIVGTMAQKMLDENLRIHEEKLENVQTKTDGADR